jgi:parallel beta-helix repeat protein
MAKNKFRAVIITSTLFFVLFFGMLGFSDNISKPVSAAKSIIVDDDGFGNYTTIQDAIDNASAGDTIYVWSGTYYENVIVNKSVTLIGNSSGNTTIDGMFKNISVMKITEDDVYISGFNLINSGKGTITPYPAGIEVNSVKNITITDNKCSFNTNGINILYSTNVTIQNNNVTENDNLGILVLQSNSNSILDNLVLKNGEPGWGNGIILFYSDSNEIINNSCLNNNLGISIQVSSFNTIDKNRCEFGGVGIYLYYNANSNTIRNSVCNLNTKGILVQWSNSNTIIDNKCDSNADYEFESCFSDENIIKRNIFNKAENTQGTNNITIFLNSISDCTFENNELTRGALLLKGTTIEHYNTHIIDISNTVDNKPIYYYKNSDNKDIPENIGQIILANCTGFQIENRDFINKYYPLTLGFSNFNHIINNIFDRTFWGYYSFFSDHNVIFNNSFTDCNVGSYLYGSSFNIISENEYLSDYRDGIYLDHCTNITLSNNTIYLNTLSGLRIVGSENNNIEFNNISNNLQNGLYLNTSNQNQIINNSIEDNIRIGINISDSNQNQFYHNNIIKNPSQASLLGGNFYNEWDNGLGEGNFWSDYTGLDNGANNRTANDGIGDTKLPHLGLDNYPIMNRSGWQYAGIPILYDPGELDIDGNYKLEWYPNRGTISYLLEEDRTPDFKVPRMIYNGSDNYFNIQTQSNGTYYYRVKALGDKYYSSWSNIVDITVDLPPNIPQNLSISVHPEGNVLNLSWKSPIVDVDFYDLYYKTTEKSSWTFLISLPHPIQTYDHIDLTDGMEYSYRIQAFDARGQKSKFSQIATGIPRDSIPPKIPQGLQVIEETNNSITISWEANSETDLMGYNIYRYSIASPDGWGKLVGVVLVDYDNRSFTDVGLIEQTTNYYAVTAYDEVPNESNISLVVTGTTKLGLHGPELNQSIPDISINEDDSDSTSVNLYRVFKDKNKDPLNFWWKGSDNISITIFQSTGVVLIEPKENWHGQETILFYASDGIFNISYGVKITINPLNDPPTMPLILEPKNLTEIQEGALLNFTGQCYDPDLPLDNLTFRWISDVQGALGTGKNLVYIELVPGTHKITLEVTDISMERVNTSISLIVKKINTESLKEDQVTDYYVIMAGIIIIIILIFSLFIFIYKKQKTREDISKASEPTVSRFSLLSLKVSDQKEHEGKLHSRTINKKNGYEIEEEKVKKEEKGVIEKKETSNNQKRNNVKEFDDSKIQNEPISNNKIK